MAAVCQFVYSLFESYFHAELFLQLVNCADLYNIDTSKVIKVLLREKLKNSS